MRNRSIGKILWNKWKRTRIRRRGVQEIRSRMQSKVRLEIRVLSSFYGRRVQSNARLLRMNVFRRQWSFLLTADEYSISAVYYTRCIARTAHALAAPAINRRREIRIYKDPSVQGERQKWHKNCRWGKRVFRVADRSSLNYRWSAGFISAIQPGFFFWCMATNKNQI